MIAPPNNYYAAGNGGIALMAIGASRGHRR
jgi:hypothetical protein